MYMSASRSFALGLALLATPARVWAAPAPPDQHLSGRVLADDTATPLANARILIGLRLIGRTSNTGEFDLTVPKGKNPLRVEKAGYLSAPIDGSGTKLEVRMIRAATLIVRVVDESGAPVGLRGIRLAGPFGLAHRETDERGTDRITGLSAGRYVAEVEPYAGPAAADADDRTEQTQRSVDAREETLDRRDSGVKLPAGQTVTITVVDPWKLSPPVRKDSRSGSVRGRVAGPDGTPVRGAHMRLVAPLGLQTTLTDADGTYAFDNVTPGKYRLYAEATGLMPVQYGEDASGNAGQDVDVAPAQRLDSMDVRLYRGGAVSGTLRDEQGEPYELTNVQLFAVKPGTSEAITTRAAAVASTDEAGRYHIGGVRGGTYYVIARPRVGRSEGPVYYPDKLRFMDATPITIVDDRELTGIDMVLDSGRGARVSGTVTDSKGAPIAGGSVKIYGTASIGDRQAQIDRSGRFEFLNVPAGAYTLTVGSPIPFDSLTINGLASSSVKFQFPTRESGGTDVAVTGARAVNAPIQTSPKAMITGRVVLEDPSAAVSPSAFELSAARGDVRAPFKDDWTFELRDISATTRLTLTSAPPGWWLKSVTVKGVNAAEVPVEFGLAAHSRHGVTAVVSRTGARISGQVQDERGAAVPNAPVVVFAVDRSRWDDRSIGSSCAPIEMDVTW